jgi:hypothetical protein
MSERQEAQGRPKEPLRGKEEAPQEEERRGQREGPPMKKLAIALGVLALVLAAIAPTVRAADEWDQFDIESASVELSTTQAGGHPDFTTNVAVTEKSGLPYAKTRDVIVALPQGMIGNPEAFPKCTTLEFGTNTLNSECPQDSQVGTTDATVAGKVNRTFFDSPVYNMPAPGGDTVARFGFYAGGFPIFINARLDPETSRVVASVEGAPTAAELVSASTTFWGIPAASVHDPERLTPFEAVNNVPPVVARKSNLPETPFMTNPTKCGPQEAVELTLTAYQLPGQVFTRSLPFPGITGCGVLEFNPGASLKPTTSQGTTGSGLDYTLEMPTKGLQFGNLNYGSELKRAEVILPEGMTINPSEAEGLGVCSEADLAREAYDSAPNVGCPETSKIGSVEVTTPVIDRTPTGSLYLAKPYENPFGSLIALYMVVKVPDRGVMVKVAGKVTTDPETGQITTVFDDVPQLPVGSFKLHFKEGARAPLVTPPACGSYDAVSNFNPWAAPGKVTARTSSFQIESGPDHGACPSGGLPPFRPGLLAGTINNAAGTFSPFNVRMIRTDAEQEITHFSIKLPLGVVGKLAGIPFCPDAAIEAAKARKGPHGGEEELNAPSCPAASEIGRSLAGAGVGQALVYVPGKVYLAGPYNGSALSVVAITAAKAGPFDLGTVVVREALQINPETAEVFIDATGSDPLPHIIQGIPVRLRDIRAYVDRPSFMLNPTDCTQTSTASTMLGAGLDFASEADDRPVTVSTPFQAADCAALPFGPKLSLRLKGGTRRGAHPALIARLKGEGLGAAGIAETQVTLPRSEFIENAHFKTICTRVQFKAEKVPGAGCPAGSVYGKATAVTPLLDESLSGPVFLRSSEHQLPDLVIALHSGKIDVTLVGKVDSVKGQLRTTFDSVPDAPVTSFTLQMQGGKKGLFVNSTNLCKGKHRAEAAFEGQNGKELDFKPALKAKCGGKKPRSRAARRWAGR